MNIHHLELFYYVARHGGISRAVRHIPYGIQQPAVSGQMLALEDDLGTRLFERSPFRLNPAGEQLFAFVRPFFDNLDAVEARLRAPSAPQIRVGASEVALREYLPPVIQRLRRKLPQLRLSLQSGFTPQLLAWLQDRQVDLAIMPLENRPPPRLSCLRLLRVPLALIVPRSSRHRSAADIWAPGRVREPLITMPATEPIARRFQQGLRRRKIDWPPALEASSLELITQYVVNGEGIGLTVNLPGVVQGARVRVLPLAEFEPVVVAALWHGRPTPLIRAVLEEGQRHLGALWPEWRCDDALPAAEPAD
jgi:DNA-binding transcriptional LysR family regulator